MPTAITTASSRIGRMGISASNANDPASVRPATVIVLEARGVA